MNDYAVSLHATFLVMYDSVPQGKRRAHTARHMLPRAERSLVHLGFWIFPGRRKQYQARLTGHDQSGDRDQAAADGFGQQRAV